MLYTSASNALVLLIDFLGPVSAAHVVPALLKAFPIGFGLLAHDVLNDEGSCGIGQRGGSALLSSGCTAVEVVGLIETCLACGQANVNTHALFQAALVLAPGGAAVFRVVAVGQPVIHIVVHDFLVLDLQRIAILCLISCPDFGAVGCPRYRDVDVNRQIENGCAVLGFIQTIEDAIATIVRSELELLGFARITVPQGQRRTVRFRFNLNQMAFPDEYSVWHLEAGRFTISAGPNSADLPLTANYIQPCTREILPEAREYFAEWDVVEE